MGDQERGYSGDGSDMNCAGGGFSIFLNEREMISFMEEGDFSSARDLDHFRNIITGIENRLDEKGRISLLALSVGDKRIARDFSVIQIAHLLAKHGKKVLIVDCDFLLPGLSGLVENIEDQGFLDLLLYGSSLKSVVKPVGIEGVSVTGAGSFPVSRTVPFALKEFSKANNFLSARGDVVIYCSTLYTEEGSVTPLSALADSLLLCCLIDEIEEGGLEKRLKVLGPDSPPADVICFCEGKESAKKVQSAVPDDDAHEEDEEILDLDPDSELPQETHDEDEESLQPAFIEKSEEIDTIRKEKKSLINLPRLLITVFAVLVAAFIIWWLTVNRSVQEKEGSSKMKELVQKQQDARDLGEKTAVEAEGDAALKDGSDIAKVEGEKPDALPVEDRPAGDKEATGDAVAEGSIADQEQPVSEGDLEKTEETVPETVTPAPEGMYYSVHVASFKDIQRAGRETEWLEAKGFDVKVIEGEVRGQTWFRIYVGEMATKEEAEELRKKLIGYKRISYTRTVKLSY